MKRAAIAALVMLAMGVSALSASAQTTEGEAVGTIYMSGSNTSYAPNIEVVGFSNFTMYLVVELDYADIGLGSLNAGVGLQGWEAGVDVPGVGADFIITAAIIRNESLNVGNNTNVIAGIDPPVTAAETPIDLMEYTLLAPSDTPPEDVHVTIGPASPTSFLTPGPGFNESEDVGECVIINSGNTTKCLRPFAETREAVLNCVNDCIVSVSQPDSWGAIKAKY